MGRGKGGRGVNTCPCLGSENVQWVPWPQPSLLWAALPTIVTASHLGGSWGAGPSSTPASSKQCQDRHSIVRGGALLRSKRQGIFLQLCLHATHYRTMLPIKDTDLTYWKRGVEKKSSQEGRGMGGEGGGGTLMTRSKIPRSSSLLVGVYALITGSPPTLHDSYTLGTRCRCSNLAIKGHT